MNTLRLCLTIFFTIWSIVAFAGDEIDCTDSGSTYCQAKFQNTYFEKADKELNKLYKSLVGSGRDKQGRLFIESQRAWLIYRDKLCEAEDIGGGINSIDYISCKARVTQQRVDEIKAYLHMDDDAPPQ